MLAIIDLWKILQLHISRTLNMQSQSFSFKKQKINRKNVLTKKLIHTDGSRQYEKTPILKAVKTSKQQF